MRKFRIRWHRLVGYVGVMLLAAGCFQAAPSDTESVSVVDQAAATFTPFPSETPMPLATETPLPELPATATIDSFALASPTTDTSGLFLATATTDFGLQTVPTLDASGSFAQQDAPTLDPFFLQPTQDPFLTENDILATAIIVGATQTVEFNLTATAQSGGFGIPTETPFVDLFVTSTPAPVLSGADCVHEVRIEDRNLYRISLRYGSTVDEIARASGITNINLIVVGQRLTIPGCGTLGVFPPATSVPSDLGQGGGAVTSGGSTVVGQGGGGGVVHVVKQNETLFQISLMYGSTVEAIMSANPGKISNMNLIYIGDEYVIP